jgi:hypothetical protein
LNVNRDFVFFLFVLFLMQILSKTMRLKTDIVDQRVNLGVIHFKYKTQYLLIGCQTFIKPMTDLRLNWAKEIKKTIWQWQKKLPMRFIDEIVDCWKCSQLKRKCLNGAMPRNNSPYRGKKESLLLWTFKPRMKRDSWKYGLSKPTSVCRTPPFHI